MALVIWGLYPSYTPAWDLHVYVKAMASLSAGHDPYADGIAVQRAFHATLAEHPGAAAPFTYVYSPLTLPLLGWIARVPPLLSGSVYWILYGLGALSAVWVGLSLAEQRERMAFRLLAPAVMFFPGLLQNDVIFSGNIAYICYGLVLLSACVGWRRQRWIWFYLAVLTVSCLKAPLLSLLAIPVFSARGQWRPALVAGAAGLALFFVQPLLWPAAFRHYLEAVELQFSFNHDFSASPAGLLAYALYDHIPYPVTSSVFYLVYAVPVTVLLAFLSRRFFAGRISFKEWAPVLLLGTLLLNPRMMEYDLAPMTLPMALLLWRFVARGQRPARALAVVGVIFGLLQTNASSQWRPMACVATVVIFGMGVYDVWLASLRRAAVQPELAWSEQQLAGR